MRRVSCTLWKAVGEGAQQQQETNSSGGYCMYTGLQAHLGTGQFAGLVEQRVGQRRLAVIDVRDDAHISRVHCLGISGLARLSGDR